MLDLYFFFVFLDLLDKLILVEFIFYLEFYLDFS